MPITLPAFFGASLLTILPKKPSILGIVVKKTIKVFSGLGFKVLRGLDRLASRLFTGVRFMIHGINMDYGLSAIPKLNTP